MKKTNEQKKRIIGQLMTKVAENEAREWPPICIGFVYQPIRPANNSKAGYCEQRKQKV